MLFALKIRVLKVIDLSAWLKVKEKNIFNNCVKTRFVSARGRVRKWARRTVAGASPKRKTDLIELFEMRDYGFWVQLNLSKKHGPWIFL